jgi:hypothetical protein
MGVPLLLWLASCGGRSVAHEDAAAGAPSAGNEAASPTTTAGASDCETLCDRCDIANQVHARGCTDFCARIENDAADAECAPLLDALVRCRTRDGNSCSLTACPNETNTFTVCVLSYCDVAPLRSWLCTAW